MKKPLRKTMTLTVVPRTGFEPVTLGLEVLCSIQLSYRGVRIMREVVANANNLCHYSKSRYNKGNEPIK